MPDGSLDEVLGSLPVPCSVSAGGQSHGDQESTADTLDGWLEDTNSNLAIVAGPFGAGKTTHMEALRDRASAQDRATHLVDFARDGDAAFSGLPTDSEVEVLVIDHFDSLNLATGAQKDPPDLRSLATLLESGSFKVALSTRRPLTDAQDELVGQLTDPERCATLHVLDPCLIELRPWTRSALDAVLNETADPRGRRLATFLGELDDYHGAELRRPLLLSMLLRVLNDLSTAPQLGDLYEKYIKKMISYDYDQKRSFITVHAKHLILRELAYDIFTGQDGSIHGPARVTIGMSRVSVRATELMDEAGQPLSSLPKEYRLVRDFLDTNHLFGPSPARDPQSTREATCEFRHPTFYDYFLGEAMADRYRQGHSLGLDEDDFSAATLDSLAIYFTKRRLDESDTGRRELQKAVSYRKWPWPDRLLMLYHLEDTPGFRKLLADTPSEYRTRLKELANALDATFITKAVKFQLVLLGEFDPYQYIADARNAEKRKDTHIEAQLQRTATGSTEFLLARLMNPDLVVARPIAVYRLGQMGDAVAIESLKSLRDTSPKLDALVDDAITEIKKRMEEASP